MIVSIHKACTVKLDGIVQSLSPDARLHLPDDKAQRLVDAGYAKPFKQDLEEYRRLVLELADRDPKGGCWDWVVQHQPEIWRGFILAFMAGDIKGARQAFNEMITAWRSNQSTTRPQPPAAAATGSRSNKKEQPP